MVMVVDNTSFRYLKTLENVHDYCKELVNLVNVLFLPLNISVVLAGVVVWSEKEEFEITTDSHITIREFARYRRDTLLQQYPNDNAVLLTRKKFGGVLGKCW